MKTRTYFAILFAIAILIFLYETSREKKCEAPTTTPSSPPSSEPSSSPSSTPTSEPSSSPTSSPTSSRTSTPSSTPTSEPTSSPTSEPTPTLSPIDKKSQVIDEILAKYQRDTDALQNKYSLGFGKYKYKPVPNEYPLNGLGPDYDRRHFSTLKSGCNKMIATPDLSFPYANLLVRP